METVICLDFFEGLRYKARGTFRCHKMRREMMKRKGNFG